MSDHEKFESDYENFKIGFLLQQARCEKGMIQEELAKKTGMTKSYISKTENNMKETRLSMFRKDYQTRLWRKFGSVNQNAGKAKCIADWYL